MMKRVKNNVTWKIEQKLEKNRANTINDFATPYNYLANGCRTINPFLWHLLTKIDHGIVEMYSNMALFDLNYLSTGQLIICPEGH